MLGDSSTESERKEIEDLVKAFDTSADGKLNYRGTYISFTPFSRVLYTGKSSSSLYLLLGRRVC